MVPAPLMLKPHVFGTTTWQYCEHRPEMTFVVLSPYRATSFMKGTNLSY